MGRATFGAVSAPDTCPSRSSSRFPSPPWSPDSSVTAATTPLSLECVAFGDCCGQLCVLRYQERLGGRELVGPPAQRCAALAADHVAAQQVPVVGAATFGEVVISAATPMSQRISGCAMHAATVALDSR
jgi:hypothetical protein